MRGTSSTRSYPRSIPTGRERDGTLASALFALGILLYTSGASADPKFPAELARVLDMPCVPQCTLCHDTLSGGYGTVHRPFGENLLQNYGLDPGDLSTVKTAVDQAEMDATDVDKDGVPDITELRQGTDPNVAGAEPICGPEYGCFARVAPHPSNDRDEVAGFAAMATVLGLVAASRKRRRA